MERITITLDEPLLDELDRYMSTRGYQNRSEALRDLTRTGLQAATPEAEDRGDCLGAVIYVYDHEARDLPKRLNQTFHDHHDLSLSTLHVHLDHHSCMEVAVLKGRTREVRSFGEHIIAERNVHYGRVVIVPLETSRDKHRHAHTGGQVHGHVHPKT